ncbi:hypothetical protein ILUMI_01877 [Ignelater luminosus]|uniref:Uncharacterized protein n=1 Tax=Ignelater luminosus TaxID=2038154 RepID=A0A8K0DJB3_IGNLU|nr:hypothetical protein ILUMI_01877 [Ignelater luminosus]
MRETKLKNLFKEDYVNERIVLVKVELRKKETWTLITVYAPTEYSSTEEKECFYETLQDTVDNEGDNTNTKLRHKNTPRKNILGQRVYNRLLLDKQ